jgi:hypothetical protein
VCSYANIPPNSDPRASWTTLKEGLDILKLLFVFAPTPQFILIDDDYIRSSVEEESGDVVLKFIESLVGLQFLASLHQLCSEYGKLKKYGRQQ